MFVYLCKRDGVCMCMCMVGVGDGAKAEERKKTWK